MTQKLTKTIKPFVTTLELPGVLPVKKTKGKCSVTVNISKGIAKIYDDNDGNTIAVPVWTYNNKCLRNGYLDGGYIGPSIVVDKGQALDIEWINALTEGHDTLPCPAVVVDGDAGYIPQNVLGVERGAQHTIGHQCSPRFSTHLHGGKTSMLSDGGPESMLLPGQSTLNRYENIQRASLLWYHDHAMHTTRLNAYTGLAGAWIVLDPEEASLELPTIDHTIPLVIQDRNLSVSADGSTDIDKQLVPSELQGSQLGTAIFNNDHVRFLHKVEGLNDHGPLEFAGPLTLVNGSIWPVTNVKPVCYRLRILNGANSRTYRLMVAERSADGHYSALSVDIKTISKQIGTDGGLLNCPVDIPEDGLTISPAERVDLLLDFTVLSGRDIVLLNTAEAPFANGYVDAIERLNNPSFYADSDEDRLPYPEVMMFKVAPPKAQVKLKPYDFDQLALNFVQLNNAEYSFNKEMPHFNPSEDQVRTVAIVEKETAAGAVLVLWELLRKEELNKNSPLLQATKKIIIDGVAYYPSAERFQDPVSYMVKFGSTERWRFLNLTADTHPMHIHLIQFMAHVRKGIVGIKPNHVVGQEDIDSIIERWSIQNPDLIMPIRDSLSKGMEVILRNDPDAAIGDLILAITAVLQTGYSIRTGAIANGLPVNGLDLNEKGFKDTIRVNPGEMVEVDAVFDGYNGRYVYHCHLLEHEDHDMMRQFVVIRDDVMEHDAMPVISVGSGEQ